MAVNPKFYIHIEILKKEKEKPILNKNTNLMFKHSCESVLMILKRVFAILNFKIIKDTLECLIVELEEKELLITFKIIRK